MRCTLGGGQRIAFQVLAVRDQDQDLVAAGTPPQRSLRLANGACNVGAAARNGTGVDGVQRLVERAIVEGNGAGQESAARERH